MKGKDSVRTQAWIYESGVRSICIGDRSDKPNQDLICHRERLQSLFEPRALSAGGCWPAQPHFKHLTLTLTPTLSLALGHRLGCGAQVGPPVEVREERDQREVHAVADEEHAGVASRAAGHVLQRRPRGGEPQPGARRCKVVRLLCCLRAWSVVATR